MSLADHDYQVWRKALHDLQIKIDNFDEAFWASVTDEQGNLVPLDEYAKAKAQYDIDRQKLVEEMDAHHRNHPEMP